MAARKFHSGFCLKPVTDRIHSLMPKLQFTGEHSSKSLKVRSQNSLILGFLGCHLHTHTMPLSATIRSPELCSRAHTELWCAFCCIRPEGKLWEQRKFEGKTRRESVFSKLRVLTEPDNPNCTWEKHLETAENVQYTSMFTRLNMEKGGMDVYNVML